MPILEPTVTYHHRDAVVAHLLCLMRTVLSHRDYGILLALCGFPDNTPQSFTHIAVHFGLDSAAQASCATAGPLEWSDEPSPVHHLLHICTGFPPSGGVTAYRKTFSADKFFRISCQSADSCYNIFRLSFAGKSIPKGYHHAENSASRRHYAARHRFHLGLFFRRAERRHGKCRGLYLQRHPHPDGRGGAAPVYPHPRPAP